MKKRIAFALVFTLVAATALVFTGCGEKKADEPKAEITIAAAASLENVFTKELIPAFEKKHPNIKVSGTYDASGKLQTQIEEGAAIDIFFSAANKQMKALEDKDLIDSTTKVDLLKNDVVLIKAKGEKAEGIKEYKDIVNADTIAIGDPASVPAGQYAQKSFENLGIWEAVQAKEVSKGTNVTEVLNWVAAGSAKVGVVYKSDAMSMPDKVEVIATAPKEAIDPAVYPVAVVKATKNPEAAKAFIEFLKTDEAIKIFQKYGFEKN